MSSFFPGGLGGTVDMVATNRPFYGIASTAYYVHSPTGSNLESGRDKQYPLATLRQAILNANPNDVIVLLDGHQESVATVIAVSKRGLVIAGCGQTAGVPNVTIVNTASSGSTFTVSAVNVQFRNVRVLENAQLNTSPGMVVTAAGLVLDGCRFEAGANNFGSMVSLGAGADRMSIRDTTFISTAENTTVQPGSALVTTAAVQGLSLRGVEFSDGIAGFESTYAADFSFGALTDLMGDSVSLLLGASMRLGATTTGYLIPTVTGGGSIDT